MTIRPPDTQQLGKQRLAQGARQLRVSPLHDQLELIVVLVPLQTL